MEETQEPEQAIQNQDQENFTNDRIKEASPSLSALVIGMGLFGQCCCS